MKIICQADKGDGSGFHEIGTTHQTILSHYTTIKGAIRYGVIPWTEQHDGVARCLVYRDDNIYKETPDNIFYVQFGRTFPDMWVEAGIWVFLPRENALGFTARQIARELKIELVIVEDVIERMMETRQLTYDATGYCRRDKAKRIASDSGATS